MIGALGGLTFQKIGLSKLGDTERIFAHALAGGTLEVLGGGKFGHGFISAGLSKALSPLADTGHLFRDGLVNAVIGGTVSEITGGDFANGAAMAATQYAFNELASRAWTGIPIFDDLIDNAIAEEPIHTTGETIKAQLIYDVSRHVTVERVVESTAMTLSLVTMFSPTRAFFRPARVGPWRADLLIQDAYSHGYKYADRVRMRGVQDPLSHNFPYSFDDIILATKPIPKNNGYNMFQQTGSMRGKEGVFEIGVTKDGVIDHRFFRPNK